MASIRVAAVMAVHNRRELTLSCLDSLLAQRAPGVSLDIFVLDDDSTDGTAEAIARHHPSVRLLHGDGQLYWNGGMRRALAEAMVGDYDHYLWMNDGILAMLVQTEHELREQGHNPVIVVGTTRHPVTTGYVPAQLAPGLGRSRRGRDVCVAFAAADGCATVTNGAGPTVVREGTGTAAVVCLHPPLGRATVAALLGEPLPAQGVRTGPTAHAHPSYRLGRSVGPELNAAPDVETSGAAPDTGRANLAARAASGLSWSALTEARL